MDLLDRLKKQMSVVSNPRGMEDPIGFRLHSVGIGKRHVNVKGWWKTHIGLYSLDATGFSQPVRLTGQSPFIREEDMISLYAPNVSYEEYFDRPRRFEDAWIVFAATAHHPGLDRLLHRGRCFFRDTTGLVRPYIQETARIASADPGDVLSAQAAFLSILALLHRSLPSEHPEIRHLNPVTATEQTQSPFQNKVLKIIKRDLTNELSIDMLAEELSISRSALSHRFSTEMGETFVHLKTRLRIEHAQALICNTEKSLKEIAYEIGFKEASYFTRIFQKTVGFSPKDYRKVASRRIPPDEQATRQSSIK